MQMLPCTRQGTQTTPKFAELHRYHERHDEEAHAALDDLLGDLM